MAIGYAPHPPACDGCPLNSHGLGFVPPEGDLSARWLFVGQGPGQQEAMFSRPFYEKAPAGYRLAKWQRKAGFPRSSVIVANTVQCWIWLTRIKGQPSGNRDPSRREQLACWDRHVGPFVRRWLAHHAALGQGVHIVPLGGSATRLLLGLDERAGGYEKWVGTTRRINLDTLLARLAP